MPESRSKRAIAEQFAAALKRELGDNVERIILYGSVARGDDGPHSDIDLVLVVHDRQKLERLSRLLGQWIADTGVVLEVHIFTVQEFRSVESGGSALGHAVSDEGRVLA